MTDPAVGMGEGVGELNMSISRGEGYRRAAGKGEVGVEVARGFLHTVLDVPTEEITSADDNYRLGDLRTPAGTTIEVKRQPIDPARYSENFVEVFELTSGRNEHHLQGFQTLGDLLGLGPDELSQVSVVRTGRRAVLGRPAAISVSIQSIAGSAATLYVNPGEQGRAHIYLYRSDELLGHVRERVSTVGLKRGVGRSNDDTCAVFVPLPRWRWSARPGEEWHYNGIGDGAGEAIATRDILMNV